MALETFPDVGLSRGSGPRTTVRVLEKQLGDGYTQSAADGLNAAPLTFKAVFGAAPKADITTIATFLKRHGGHTPFLFTLPDETSARRWRCTTWTGPTWVSATYRSLTATFIEDFGL